MLTDHQWSPVTSIFGKFHKRCLNNQSPNPFENYTSKISFKFPRDQWVIHNQSAGPTLDHYLHQYYFLFWCNINNSYSMFLVNGCWVVGYQAKTPLALNTLKADMDRSISICRWELHQYKFDQFNWYLRFLILTTTNWWTLELIHKCITMWSLRFHLQWVDIMTWHLLATIWKLNEAWYHHWDMVTWFGLTWSDTKRSYEMVLSSYTTLWYSR